MKKKYDHKAIETKWEADWETKKLYKAPEKVDPKNKMYILPQLPYPSGAGLHAGHAEIYIACDIFARYQRMQGKDVMQVMGWDAFGLPAENYAIKTNIHPRINTDKAIDTFRTQIKALGISVDWDREVGSHNPDYYKWTQWFFLLMLKRGLAYRNKQQVNWCEHDKTVLANEQVVNGKCERCGTEIVLKEMEQWYLRITDYADRLIADLDKVDWPAETKKRQREWIGRSEGALIKFPVVGTDEHIEVFSTAHDTIFGATFMVLAPENKLVRGLSEKVTNWKEVEAYLAQAAHKNELERQQQKEKKGVRLEGILALNPMTDEEIPVFVADYVLGSYGTGAIMAVPGHDERDGEFAKRYELPVVYLVENEEFISYGDQVKDDLEKYRIANSGEFNGKTFAEARPGILDKLKELNLGEPKVQYRLRDWSVSRQRFWGAPMPIVYDPDGNPHPVSEEDLPVILPDDVDFKPTGESPLNYSPSFQTGVEEKYGKGWKREVDTLDTFMCSSWYYFRYIDPKNDKEFASPEMLKTWAPVDFYMGGQEHVTGHLLYSRFFTKVLFDAGYIDFDEPFLFNRHQGTVFGPDGRRMSKRWGNIVNPTEVVEQYGADSMRMYEMFMGPIEQDKAWNDNAVQGVRKFLSRVYELGQREFASGGRTKLVNALVDKVTKDTANLSYNTAVAEFMKTVNTFYSSEKITEEDWKTFLVVLAPYAPFIAEELWRDMGNKDSVHTQPWPKVDTSLLVVDEVTVVVQVNGKVRDRIITKPGMTNSEIEELVMSSEKVKKALEGKSVVKIVHVPDKLCNIVVR